MSPLTEFMPLLFRVDGNPKNKLELAEKGAFVEEPGKIIRCLDRGVLDENDVFLLDSGWELFVWIGNSSEKIAAMGAADRYAEMEPRAATLPVTVVKSGSETTLFLSYFLE
jgi:hypothetical protein